MIYMRWTVMIHPHTMDSDDLHVMDSDDPHAISNNLIILYYVGGILPLPIFIGR